MQPPGEGGCFYFSDRWQQGVGCSTGRISSYQPMTFLNVSETRRTLPNFTPCHVSDLRAGMP